MIGFHGQAILIKSVRSINNTIAIIIIAFIKQRIDDEIIGAISTAETTSSNIIVQCEAFNLCHSHTLLRPRCTRFISTIRKRTQRHGTFTVIHCVEIVLRARINGAIFGHMRMRFAALMIGK